MPKQPQTAYKIPVYLTQERRCFYANIKVKLPISCSESLFEEVYGVMDVVDRYYNSYTRGSYIDQINQFSGDWVEVDDYCIWLLEELKQFSALFDGVYDITAMPLLKLWGFYNKNQQITPSEIALKDVLQKVNYNQIEIKGNSVKIAKGQEIITGSFLKSFAVDLAIDFLRELGITDALINAGGSSMSVLNNEIHPCWKVNIPYVNEEKEQRQIQLANTSFSYSAMSNNYKLIQGEKHSHIINAITGNPSNIQQVVVVAKSCFESDVLATALYATGNEYENYIPILEELNASGFIVDANGVETAFGNPLKEEV